MSLCNQAQPKAHAKARGDRFARIPLWAAGVEIRPRAFRVLIAIAAHIDRDGWAYPSLASIAALTGIARNKLFAAVDQLENVGLLRRDRSKGGRSNPTRYQVVFKGPETDPRLGPIFAECLTTPARSMRNHCALQKRRALTQRCPHND
jgi:hypothetical protein